MKCKLLTGVCLFIALASSASQADPITITVDEGGIGSIGSGVLTGSVITDPTSTTGTTVLAYVLPFAVIPGDVVLTEPGTTEPSHSDLVRFPNMPGALFHLMLFYSDLPGAGEVAQLADLGVPPALPTAKILPEVGPEAGPNGLSYTPGPGDPGFATAGLTYNIISDPAGLPLPASAWGGLALVGGLAAWRVIRRKPAVQ